MKKIKHKFTEIIPDKIESDILYISTKYRTTIHLCPCGCKSEVVAPLSPTDWELSYNGESVSLSPSIGNWSLPCQSHYWIDHGVVKWARKWTREEILENRLSDKKTKKEYHKNLTEIDVSKKKNDNVSFFDRLRKVFPKN